jgi:hypothetical protein
MDHENGFYGDICTACHGLCTIPNSGRVGATFKGTAQWNTVTLTCGAHD